MAGSADREVLLDAAGERASRADCWRAADEAELEGARRGVRRDEDELDRRSRGRRGRTEATVEVGPDTRMKTTVQGRALPRRRPSPRTLAAQLPGRAAASSAQRAGNAIAPLVCCWSATVTHALASEPLTLAELDRAVPSARLRHGRGTRRGDGAGGPRRGHERRRRDPLRADRLDAAGLCPDRRGGEDRAALPRARRGAARGARRRRRLPARPAAALRCRRRCAAPAASTSGSPASRDFDGRRHGRGRRRPSLSSSTPLLEREARDADHRHARSSGSTRWSTRPPRSSASPAT